MPARATPEVPISHLTNFTAHPLCEKDVKVISRKLPGHRHCHLKASEGKHEKRGHGADVSGDIFMLLFLRQLKWLNSVGIASCLVINGNDKYAFLLNWCHVDRGHFD